MSNSAREEGKGERESCLTNADTATDTDRDTASARAGASADDDVEDNEWKTTQFDGKSHHMLSKHVHHDAKI